ncbi:MAG: hypothetical protein KF878_07505 [Planctomycetes bacterium]|nr:hypothetical protein [Planctomycetota bacterium]
MTTTSAAAPLLKGALLGLLALPLTIALAGIGWAVLSLLGQVVGAILLGGASGADLGRVAGSAIGALGGAVFALRVLAEVHGGDGAAGRVLAVLTLTLAAAAGTALSPLVEGPAPLAGLGAALATSALSGAALLAPPRSAP